MLLNPCDDEFLAFQMISLASSVHINGNINDDCGRGIGFLKENEITTAYMDQIKYNGCNLNNEKCIHHFCYYCVASNIFPSFNYACW